MGDKAAALPSVPIERRSTGGRWAVGASAGFRTAAVANSRVDETRFFAKPEGRRMIESLTVPLEKFDLDGFVEAFRKVARKWLGPEFDPDWVVTVMERFDDTPTPLHEDRDLAQELLERKWKLFFPMHEPTADYRALCIDGKRRNTDKFDISEADNYGFLVEVHDDDQISLHPALYDGTSRPFPCIELQGRCSVLDACMTAFARRFVKEN
jgi:hypothetical protein